MCDNRESKCGQQHQRKPCNFWQHPSKVMIQIIYWRNHLQESKSSLQLEFRSDMQISKVHIFHFNAFLLVEWKLLLIAVVDATLVGNPTCRYRPHCSCSVNQVVLTLTRCIYMTNAERCVSKQGHLHPRCYSKARLPNRQL